MYTSAHRSITLFFLAALFIGCGSGAKTIENESGRYPDEMIEMLIWETRGGGDLYFTAERKGHQFELSIKRHAFQPVNVVLTLKDNDLALSNLLEEIFEKRINLYDFTFTPAGTTGTWTSITLIFHGKQARIIENIKATDKKLRILPDFVRNKI